MMPKVKTLLAVAAVAPIMALGACAQKADYDELRAQIARAQATADEALALAQECNEKCDRLFNEGL